MKIKVKRVRGGSMGDQRDYGLVTGSIWNYEDKPTTNQVSDRVGPVDRDEATIEAERGETVVGDINNDGMLEHFIVGGKRHFQGGTPLNVPDGSFVFSDTRALNIKNKDVLKNIFGVTASKGMTPAKVAKKFDLNQYNDLLLDPEADAISKRTAQMMLDNNLRKLGQLALVQEGMKGFPDGIPDIALPLFGTDQASSQPSQQMMRRGGLVKAQAGKQTKAKEKSYFDFIVEQLNTRGDQLRKGIDYGLEEAGRYGRMALGNLALQNLDLIAAANQLANMPTKKTAEQKKPAPKPAPAPAPKPKVKDPYAGFSPEYKLNMSNFDRWVKEWQTAINSGDDKKIAELKKSGRNLSSVLGTVEIPRSLGFNISWLDPRSALKEPTTKPSWGSEQGMVEDAADVIDNLISAYDKGITNKQKIQQNQASQKAAVQKANDRIKVANEILADYRKNGHNTKYTSTDINNATNIIKEFKSVPLNNRYQSADANIPGYTVDLGSESGYFDPKTDSATVANIIEKYPLSSFNQVQAADAAENFPPGEQAMSPTDTSAAPNVSIPMRAADTSGQNITVDPTASTREQAVRTAPAYVPVYKRSDSEIADFLRAQGIEATAKAIQDVRDVQVEKDGGSTLAKFQGTQGGSQTGRTYYNLTDQAIKDAAKQKGYDVTYPYSWYSGQPVIGRQTNLLPSGIFTTATGPKPDIEQFRDYAGVTVAGGWQNYPGGFDKWRSDIAAAKGRPSDASRWWIDKVVNPYSVQMTGLPVIDVNQQDAYKPGVRWSQNPVFNPIQAPAPVVTPPAPAAPATPLAKSGPGAVPTPAYSPTSYYQPWSNYSNIDVMGAMMNYMDVNRGDLPTLYTYTPTQADPTFLDPARAIAQQQGLVAQSTEDIASRSFDPTTARANIIAAQAQSAEPIANIQAKYDEANTQIANQFAQQNAAALNDAQLKNIAFRDKYQGELQTLQQQYDNALREGRTEVAEAIKRAMVDQMQRGALNAQNINYKIGADGQIYYSPGYNPFTGENMYASAGYSQFNKLLDIYSKPPYNYTPENAIKAASAAAKLEEDKTAKYGMSVSNPMDIIWG